MPKVSSEESGDHWRRLLVRVGNPQATPLFSKCGEPPKSGSAVPLSRMFSPEWACFPFFPNHMAVFGPWVLTAAERGVPICLSPKSTGTRPFLCASRAR